MSAEDQTARSPWITLWLSPRQTIERLVATRPSYFVWLLLIAGTAAGFYNQIVLVGGAGDLLDWRLALGFVLGSVAVAISSFYVGAWIFNALAGWLGGKATVSQTRAALAWSTPPVILGGVVISALGAVVKKEAIPEGVVELLVVVFSLWSIFVFLLMLGRVQHFGFWRAVLTGLLNVLLAAFIAVFIRSFLYQPFNIPSGSMRPTLLVGDYVFVSKFAYGYGRFSLPFSMPSMSGRIFASEPARGDVVVFRMPKQNTDFIKRLVGLPGDRIQMKQGVLVINDTPVGHEPAPANRADADACGLASADAIKRWRETLPNGVSYETIDCTENGPLDDTRIYTVPPGQFFMLGDNRDNSSDSRLTTFGDVTFENLIGRASVLYYSRKAADDGTAPQTRTERIGMVVR